MQHEILSEIPLLDKNGDLTEAGFAKKLLPSTGVPISRQAPCASRNGTTT